MEKAKRRIRISRTSALHYWKFGFRTALFLAAAAVYVIGRINNTGMMFGGFEDRPAILMAIWLVFFIEMVLRFFPSKFESMGCEKQFARNFVPAEETGGPKPQTHSRPGSALAVAAAWLLLNAAIGALYIWGVIDDGIMVLICLAFSVCDMICILFFCPFQTWFMKNKCCGSCRIYNWDYAMMFTPLLFVRNIYTWSILALAIGLLIKWELVHWLHPERFAEATNASLACANCTEKLCQHKKSLQKFLKAQRHRFFPNLDRGRSSD